MGRSVSTPCNAEHIAYATFDLNEHVCNVCDESFWEFATRPAAAGDCEHDEGLDDDEQADVNCCPHCLAHEDDCCWRDPQDDFSWCSDDYREQLIAAFPSVKACDEWIDREDHAVAENDYAYFGVSEYCGLVAMWVAPKSGGYYAEPGFDARRDHWIGQIGKRFSRIAATCFGQSLRSVGTFSNGEQVFQPANGQQQGGMGLGFSSKEGWI